MRKTFYTISQHDLNFNISLLCHNLFILLFQSWFPNHASHDIQRHLLSSHLPRGFQLELITVIINYAFEKCVISHLPYISNNDLRNAVVVLDQHYEISMNCNHNFLLRTNECGITHLMVNSQQVNGFTLFCSRCMISTIIQNWIYYFLFSTNGCGITHVMLNSQRVIQWSMHFFV